jgi:hypothetical protein
MRRPALYFTVAAVLVALAAAALYAALPRSSSPASLIEPSSADSAITATGSATVAIGGELLGSGSGTAAGDIMKPRARHGRFGVKVGTVSGLYPGKIQRLPVWFSNPLPYPIRIRTATTSATGPGACPADANLLLRTRTFPHLIVGTNTTKRKFLRFGMLKAATDACQSGAFTVTVTAKAVRAR